MEDVLEKYWNDHRMDHTVEYLLKIVLKLRLTFFNNSEHIGTLKAGRRIGHQLEDLYKRLLQFLNENNIANSVIAEGLMKYDYLINQRYKPRNPGGRTNR